MIEIGSPGSKRDVTAEFTPETPIDRVASLRAIRALSALVFRSGQDFVPGLDEPTDNDYELLISRLRPGITVPDSFPIGTTISYHMDRVEFQAGIRLAFVKELAAAFDLEATTGSPFVGVGSAEFKVAGDNKQGLAINYYFFADGQATIDGELAYQTRSNPNPDDKAAGYLAGALRSIGLEGVIPTLITPPDRQMTFSDVPIGAEQIAKLWLPNLIGSD